MDLRSKHALVLMERLWRMKETGEMTDVVLVTEGVCFPCHRVVLSAFSPYFRAMFTCGLQECNRTEVMLQDTPPEILRLILNYMYRSELPLCNTNVQGVAVAAFILQLDDVFEHCQRHMTDNMDASNCLGVYYFARDLGAEDLRDLAYRFLRQNFAQVCLHEEVVDLECYKLLALIGSDDLNVSREESILDVVLRWVNRDPDGRAANLPELLRKVRLPLVSPDFLREALRRNTVLLASAECHDMVHEALDIIQCPPLATPRKLKLRYGMETVDLLLCIGVEGHGLRSRHSSYSDYSFCFSPTTSQIHYITSPSYGEALGYVCAGVVTHDNQIVVAGEAGARRLSRESSQNVDLYRYNESAQGSWKKLSSAEHRDMYALGVVGDTLFLLGGMMKLRKKYFMTNSVERWSMRGGAWRSTTPLPLPLAYHCAVTLNDRLYVLGGRTPQ
ncbi:hypothetical protein GJAV_G00175210, partial [Gymnothorax javanicus]